jgi:hypothetical protein
MWENKKTLFHLLPQTFDHWSQNPSPTTFSQQWQSEQSSYLIGGPGLFLCPVSVVPDVPPLDLQGVGGSCPPEGARHLHVLATLCCDVMGDLCEHSCMEKKAKLTVGFKNDDSVHYEENMGGVCSYCSWFTVMIIHCDCKWSRIEYWVNPNNSVHTSSFFNITQHNLEILVFLRNTIINPHLPVETFPFWWVSFVGLM